MQGCHLLSSAWSEFFFFLEWGGGYCVLYIYIYIYIYIYTVHIRGYMYILFNSVECLF